MTETCLSLGPILGAPDLSDGLIDPQVLVILGDLIDHATSHILEDGEVLDDIQQPGRLTDTPENGVTRSLT